MRGIATVSFYSADLNAAQAWYTEVLGIEPYFARPGYIEFRIGDYQHELGIIQAEYASHEVGNGPAGAVVYWHVDDVTSTVDRLVVLGATLLDAPVNRSPHEPDPARQFVTATVTDPFGNILGVMRNPHYLRVLNSNA
ncbi:VOC family protein [Longispora albida]|uniref:VOC family protein n=1 Tax=Longispora albida TaxID=203523 RepID=UPI000360730D|nr:VOC family protein [Longispora albida]